MCDFHYKSSALALNFSILLYIHYDREPLGIFSHVPRLGGEISEPYFAQKPEELLFLTTMETDPKGKNVLVTEVGNPLG